MYKGSVGIFDSGIGGLTVAKEIIQRFPNESILYVGDTARVPYGNRSEDVISKFALEMVGFLISLKVKILVVACNTISAVALEKIKAISPVPVLDVISSATSAIIASTKSDSVGIIGTRATINSQAYEKELHKINPKLTIYTKACPLFIPVVEEGLGESEIAKLLAKRYLSDFNNTDIDVLHFGCTHFPLLKNVIREVINPNIQLIDSAKSVTDELESVLTRNNLQNGKHSLKSTFYVTDAPEKVKLIAENFFGKDISHDIKKITLKK